MSLSDLPDFDGLDSTASTPANTGDVVFGAAATEFMSQDALDRTAQEEAVDSLAPDPFESSDSDSSSQPQPFSSTPITTRAFTYDTNVKEEKRGGGVAKRVLIVTLSVILVLVLVYVGVGVFFTSHFMPNTTVNGEDVSGMSVVDLASHIKQIGDQYTAHVNGDGIDIQVKGPDIGLVYDGDAYAAEAQKQINAWAWPMEIMNKHDYQAQSGITFDQARLEAVLDPVIAGINANATPPTNATMSYNATTRQFDVVPEQFGTAVERDSVINTVAANVSKLKDNIALGQAELVQPALPQSDVRYVAGINSANALLAANIPFSIAGKDAYNMEPNVLAGWLSLNDEGNVIVNTDAAKEWAQGTLSEAFDTVGMAHQFTRPDGKVIEVAGGTYGWVVDGEALADVLTQNLQSGNTSKIEVPMKETAANWAPGGKEWPNRYIDVDLSEQYVRMYDDNNNVIWETECVSGNPIYGGGTDEGVYYIYLKASPMELVGLDYNGDGEPDYRTPVTYWMPFDGGEGLHDASWRGAFGGTIYLYDGSHGCVNLPYYAAEELYGITNVGDVVIVHS
ncbi:MAG: L,D-transpeptidase [Coriobacteriales bacterium]|nr:L,D-transpeptidase [Coriobacteriales bacterium]